MKDCVVDVIKERMVWYSDPFYLSFRETLNEGIRLSHENSSATHVQTV